MKYTYIILCNFMQVCDRKRNDVLYFKTPQLWCKAIMFCCLHPAVHLQLKMWSLDEKNKQKKQKTKTKKNLAINADD